MPGSADDRAVRPAAGGPTYHSYDGRFAVRRFPTFAATVDSARDVDHLLLVVSQERRQTG